MKNLIPLPPLWGLFLGIFFIGCNSTTNTQENLDSLFLLLNQQKKEFSTNQENTSFFNLINAFLFNKITEAPGNATDAQKQKAINGIYGAGKLAGSLDVYLLQSSNNSIYCKPNEKCIVLEIENKKIMNTSGIDFVVFENPFCIGGENYCNTTRFMEPVIVEVSFDLINWCGWNPQYIGSDTNINNLSNPSNWQRFAGIEPVLFNQNNWSYTEEDIFDKTKAGGDGFDLDDPNFGLSGDNCNNSIKNQILSNGFIYLRLVSANSRGFTYHPSDSFDQTADIDGVIAKSALDR